MDADLALHTLDSIGRFSEPGVEVFYDPAERPQLYVLALAAEGLAQHGTGRTNQEKVARIMIAAAVLLRDEATARGMPATMEECLALVQRRDPIGGCSSHPEGNSDALAIISMRLLRAGGPRTTSDGAPA